MTITPIKVMNQLTGSGGIESCGFHALKNSLLSLLLQHKTITQKQFDSLIINTGLFEDLFKATKKIAQTNNRKLGQKIEDANADVSFPVMIELLDMVKQGKIDLSKYGITPEMLKRLNLDQNGTENLSVVNLNTGIHNTDYGLFGMEGDLVAASTAARLARIKTSFNHVIAFGLNDKHWVAAAVHQNDQGVRTWQFMDSERYPSLFQDAAIAKIEDVLKKNDAQLKTYLLDVYDAVNHNDFNVRYRSYFDDQTGLPKALPDNLGETYARIYFLEENQSRFASYIHTRFIFMKTAGWLDAKDEAEHAHIKQLYAVANYMYENAEDEDIEAKELGAICAQLKLSLEMPLRKDIKANVPLHPGAVELDDTLPESMEPPVDLETEEEKQAKAAQFAAENQHPKPTEGFFDNFVKAIKYMIEKIKEAFEYIAEGIKAMF